MVDLRSLDDIPIPDRWDDIRSSASEPDLPLTLEASAPGGRRRPLLVAATAVAVVGAALLLARTSDPQRIDVAEPPGDVVVLNDDPRITLAGLGPEPAFDTDELGEEVTWDRTPPNAVEIAGLAAAEISVLDDPEIESFEVLGRVGARLWASRVAVGEPGVEESELTGVHRGWQVVGVAPNGVADGQWALAPEGYERAGTIRTRWSRVEDGLDPTGTFVVENASDDAAVITLETGSGDRLWMRPAGGVAVFPIALDDFEGYTVRTLDASGGLLDTLNQSDTGLLETSEDTWLLPATLPSGFEFEVALIHQGSRTLHFRDDHGGLVTVTVNPTAFEPEPADEPVDVAGTEWFRRNTGLWLSRDIGIGTVTVAAPGLGDEALRAVAASLRVSDEGELPRRPINLDDGPWIEVATATWQGRLVTYSVTSDGRFFGSRDGTVEGTSRTCCMALDAGEVVALQLTSSFDLEAERLLVRGLADESVARVEVMLADGTAFELIPQDRDDAFPVNFFFADVPTLEVPSATVRAIAADGSELGAWDGAFPNLTVTRSPVPSQTEEAARRDGVIPELAALALDERLSPGVMVRPTDVREISLDGDTRWVLSQPDLFEIGDQGCLGDRRGTYGIDFVCSPDYGEILELGPVGIERAYPLPGLPAHSLAVTDQAVYCFRQGDGGLPDSMLCRIDLVTGELTVRVFPSRIDSAFGDDSQPLPGWLLDGPQPIGFETLTATGDGRLIVTGGGESREVDPITLGLRPQ